MNREQHIIANLAEWGKRSAWAAQVAKTKLRELEAKSNRDVLRRVAPSNGGRS